MCLELGHRGITKLKSDLIIDKELWMLIFFSFLIPHRSVID